MTNKTVSIIIVSFNSSEFIVETLESILKQTWEDIELIITDDCSTDNTVELCHNWLNNNKHRFVNTLLLTSEKNTGVSANANRGLKTANGDWIKFLGADDTLKPKCIEENMSWVTFHPEIKVLFSKIEVYKDTFEPHYLINTIPGDPYNPESIIASNRSAESQYKMLLINDRVHFSPSVFLHRETIVSLGGFDERFKLLEDYPLWLNLTKNGICLNYMDKITINYRRHSKAINNTGISHIVNPNYFRSEAFRKIYIYPYLPFDLWLKARYIWYVCQIFRNIRLNRDIQSFRLFHLLLTVWVNPFLFFIWLRKKINKNLANNELYK